MGLNALLNILRWSVLAMTLLAIPAVSVAQATVPAEVSNTVLAPLADGNTDAKLQVIMQLGRIPDPRATDVLQALNGGRLYVAGQTRFVILDSDRNATDALTGEAIAAPPEARAVMVNNRMRRAIAGALAASQLFSNDSLQRLAAARALQRSTDTALLPVIEEALSQETHGPVRGALQTARAVLQLRHAEPAERLLAVEALGDSGDGAFRPVLLELLATDGNGAHMEPDEAVRIAAEAALDRIDSHQKKIEWAGNLFYGISLGSVLLLAALGLAITFGLMGVINMAHGELLMIGAYVTYLTQLAFRQYAPAWMDWYVIAALPLAFVASAGVGMVLERTVIRWLYGRPLETLLATWGISLILMQSVRTLFGAQNVEVSNPDWMTGGITVMGGLSLSYNRIAIIIFALLVVFLVWLLLNHTRLGLFIRAITQNRRMADCVGVPTGRIDMLSFGLGSGIAGLGGVALSQLGNVGPDLGRGYIVDSFMVVVLGGVGQLAGTVTAALSLGVVSKFVEPWTGAVIAKITILVLIVLFIQKRPQGLFAPRGRSVE